MGVTVWFWVYTVIIAVVSYLLSGINGATIASMTFFKKDIREYGSKNAGLTNFYRVFGTKGVLLVLAIDILKAALSVLLGWWLLGLEGYSMLGKLFAGFFAILGHVFPIYYRFKGGKGVLCGGILVLLVDWRIGLISWGVFLLLLLLTRYVSLSSICSTAAFPISMACFGREWYEVLVAACCAVLIIARHSENILRLIKGQESKLSFKKK